MTVKRLSLPRAYQAINEALQNEILSGRLQPGQPLPTETELAEQFGVSRHSVREGMRALEQSGLVKRGGARRLLVTLPHHEDLAPNAKRALQMHNVSFRELWEVSMHIETCAIELALNHVDPELPERLEENVAKTEARLAKGHSIVALDVEFHNLIASAANNRVLLLSREPVSQLFYPALERLFDHPKTRDVSPHRLVKAHKQIAAAIKSRDKAKAREWVSRHMADFRRGYEFAGIDLESPAC
jgi:DNA-binding FadR family transcriptional regulator